MMNKYDRGPDKKNFKRVSALALAASVGLAGESQAQMAYPQQAKVIAPLTKLADQAEKRIQQRRNTTVLNGMFNRSFQLPNQDDSVGGTDIIDHPIVVKRRAVITKLSMAALRNGDFALGSISLESGKPKVTLKVYNPDSDFITLDTTKAQPIFEDDTLVKSSAFDPTDALPDFMHALNANGDIRMHPEVASPYAPSTPIPIGDAKFNSAK